MLVNIQILRAYAAIAVAFFHINVPGLPYGSFGVHIFFVISGFIIGRSCMVSSKYFFTRRIIRIVPAYWACTLGIFVIALVKPAWLNFTTANVDHLFKSLFFIPYRKEHGLMQPMLDVGWTLNYEMFFYLIVSLSLWAAGARYAIFLACATLVVILKTLPNLCASDACTFYSNPISYEFCYGMLAYYLWHKRWLQGVPRWIWCGIFTASALALPLIEAHVTLGGVAMPVDMEKASVGLVFSAAMLERAFLPVWKKYLASIGDASYLIYLIHMYVIQLFNKIIIPVLPALTLNRASGICLCLVIIITLSLVLHCSLEKPLHDLLKKKLVRRSET